MKSSLSFLLGLLFLTSQVGAQSIHSPLGLSATVAPDGTYSLATASPAWQFGGTIGTRPTALASRRGSDGIGEFEELVFSYVDGGRRQAGVRIYRDRPVFLFTSTFSEGGANKHPFPSLAQYPALAHHLSYEKIFGAYSFHDLAADSPWLFFRRGGKRVSHLGSVALSQYGVGVGFPALAG